MDMKKKILLSMILLALCLIQASADTYYYRILLSPKNGDFVRWSNYIDVGSTRYDDQQKKYVYVNGLRDLIYGNAVTDEKGVTYTLPQKANNEVDLDGIRGIMFANGKGRYDNDQSNILEGDEFDTWTEIRTHIKYLGLREYKCNTYTNSGYFMDMYNVEELELPKDGMTVGNGDEDCVYYFANARKLKKITIKSDDKKDPVDITNNAVTDKVLRNSVGKFMFSNCWALSPKYINRLIKDVTEIKDNAFFANDGDRDKLAANNMGLLRYPTQ